MELEPDRNRNFFQSRNRNRNHNFSKVGNITFQKSEPEPGTVIVMSTISKRKQKRSDIDAYYRNESKTFWFGPLKVGTEAERFGLVRIFLYQKQFVTVLAHRF
jgi:hypothetical protein